MTEHVTDHLAQGADPHLMARTAASPRRWPRIAAVATAGAVLAVTAIGAGVNTAVGTLSDNITALDVSDNTGTTASAGPAIVSESGSYEPFTVLLLGSDTRAGKGNGGFGSASKIGGQRSDTTIILHVSADRKHAIAVSIPRDTWMKLPECKDGDRTVGGYETRFNSAMDLGGPGCTLKAVQALTGLNIDHFMMVDFGGFKRIVDAVGGVEVCVAEDINDPKSGLVLTKGKHTLDGKQGLAFVRARKTLGDGSDTSRIRRQQAFLSSMVRKVVSAGTLLNPAALVQVLDAGTQSLTADPGLADGETIKQLALSMKDLRPGDVTFTTMPWRPSGDGATVKMNRKKAQEIWDAIANDTPWPAKGSAPGMSEDQPLLTVAPDEITINVLNGTGVPGRAKEVAKEFRQAGYNVIQVGNADAPVTQTTVQYDPRWDTSAKTIIYAAGGVGEKVKKMGGTFTVIIGPDFEGVNPVVINDIAKDRTANVNTAADSYCAQ